MKMSHALFGIETRRDPARERLAPLLSDLRLTDAHARERGAGRFALRARPRRSRRPRDACA
jgi:hypothetical protein